MDANILEAEEALLALAVVPACRDVVCTFPVIRADQTVTDAVEVCADQLEFVGRPSCLGGGDVAIEWLHPRRTGITEESSVEELTPAFICLSRSKWYTFAVARAAPFTQAAV